MPGRFKWLRRYWEWIVLPLLLLVTGAIFYLLGVWLQLLEVMFQ